MVQRGGNCWATLADRETKQRVYNGLPARSLVGKWRARQEPALLRPKAGPLGAQ